MDDSLTLSVPCRRYRSGVFSDITDEVAREIHVTIRLAGSGERRLFAAPLDPETLALGHAALEMAGPGLEPVLTHADGLMFDLITRPAAPQVPDPSLPRPVAAADLLALVRRFTVAPGLWEDTGCFHRAALYDTLSGQFLTRAEDIGRHNCLDRLVGYAVRQRINLSELILFLSCRVTASMMDKALRAGMRMIVSRSAVTGAALAAAEEAGVTLVGFAREAEERFTVFTDALGKVAP